MHILGINAWHGDVSAVLLRDGKVVAALEEERFRRVKHWAGFPTLAIRKCLETGSISADEIDHIAVSRDPQANFWRKVRFTLAKRPGPRLLYDRLRNRGRIRNIRGPLAEALETDTGKLPDIHNVEHHPAHLASAFFVSPFQEAAVCAIDGFGDFVSTSIATGKDNRLEILDNVYFPHSLGMLYTAITQYLGFTNYGDEYKVMGLAPYGKPQYVEGLMELIDLKKNGKFELNLEYFCHWSDDIGMEWEEGYPSMGRVYTDKLDDLLGLRRHPDEDITQTHKDIACSLQVVYEKAMFHVLNDLWQRTRLPALCLAGGCAMNSVANGKIRKETPFEKIYIQPAAADNGTALGAAYWVWNQLLKKPRIFRMDHAYWGTRYSPQELTEAIEYWLKEQDVHFSFNMQAFENEEALCNTTAQKLSDGKVIGWFRGRMEWGARALGNRSILADPRRADMRSLINKKIKMREDFRPFAPSVLAEACHDFFEGAAQAPFMQQVYPVKKDKRPDLPAVTHVDGSGRMQTVHQETNPTFYRLIKSFGDLTGIPVLLNTSFNENEPIVESPKQALDCFLRTTMDVLVLGNTMIERKGEEDD